MSKRVLLTGASGLLGRAVFAAFEAHPEWEVCGLAFSRASGKLIKADLNNAEQIKQIVSDFKPSIIIHTAAKRKADDVENQVEMTKALNVGATQSLSQIALGVGAPVIYISTDYVFDGTSPPYAVDAKPNPLNKYGISKLDGEREAMRTSDGNMVLRLPILYGEVEDLSESAITCLFTCVLQPEKECLVSDYEIKFPTHVEDVAKVLMDLCDRKLADPNLGGIFHWSGDESLTKYAQSLLMAEVMDLPHAHLRPDNTPSRGAPRPHNPQLDTSRLQALGICHQRSFKSSIRAVLEPHLSPGSSH